MSQSDPEEMDRFCVNIANLSESEKIELMEIILAMPSYRRFPTPLQHAGSSSDLLV